MDDADDLQDFLEGFFPAPVRPTVLVDVDTGDDFTDFIPADDVVQLEGCEDPDIQRAALLRKFPEASPGYLDRVVASSRHHVWAMLKDKTDKRVDELLALFLKYDGVITTKVRERARINPVAFSYLRDTGLIDLRTGIKEGSRTVFRYELDLERFNVNRGSREDLTGRARKELIARFGKCNICGSVRDLRADHRIGVSVAGKAATDFQALCHSCNCAKREACEKCPVRDDGSCGTCSWAYPENHTHTAGEAGTLVSLRLPLGASVRARTVGLSVRDWVASVVDSSLKAGLP